MKNIDKQVHVADQLEPGTVLLPEDVSDFHLFYDYIHSISILDMNMRVTEYKLEDSKDIYRSLYLPSLRNPDNEISEFITKINYWLAKDNSKLHNNFQKIAIALYVQVLVDKQKYYPLKSINRRLHGYKLKASQQIESLNRVLIEKDLKIKELLEERDLLKNEILLQYLELKKIRLKLQGQ